MISMLLGVIMGLPIALIRFYRVPFFSTLLSILITSFRGIPIVIFYLVFYILFSEFGRVPVSFVAIVALSFPATVRMSEAFRGALESVNKNQFDAAYSVGHSGYHVLVRIVLPQIIPVILPFTGNICIQMLKSVPIASIIGMNDILNTALLEATINYRYIESYFAAGVIFWGLFILIEKSFLLIEAHFKKQMYRGVA
ncbi:ABC transporter permease subunit [Treponema primitia]|uniref:ABC transporter permease subunit n=1 Tax=Treponema primitia TaxID=88058 RepID=UPI00397FF807